MAPAELARLAERAGTSLYTSSYLARLEAMRVLALTVLNGNAKATGHDAVELWLRRMGGPAAVAA
ncbi:hypothetical protein PJ267_02340 [Arthrobacter sp. OVS8]|nr:hypothetical protein PJ267_02340 [Arthrobacter sp. OVS8]